ncbi:MAG: hypothetical protein WDN76_03890 [Alphaproteobacteria bacterium]
MTQRSYFILEPEVAGSIGVRSDVDWETHPPTVQRLHYEFDGWLGGSIVASFPCFAVTAAARDEIEALKLSGASFEDMEVSKSDLFEELHPQKVLPQFFWLKVAANGDGDFSTDKSNHLIVSDRALAIFEEQGLSDAVVTPLPSDRS